MEVMLTSWMSLHGKPLKTKGRHQEHLAVVVQFELGSCCWTIAQALHARTCTHTEHVRVMHITARTMSGQFT